MELLEEFYEKDSDPSLDGNGVRYKVRKSVRAVMLNGDGEIALMYVLKNGYHKLPGGGVKKEETLMAALEREIRKETGYAIQARPQSIGVAMEYRDADALLQISYCYLADALGEPEAISLSDEEKALGMQLEWMKLEEAVGVMERDSPADYTGHFIRRRDLAFLQKAKTIVHN